MYEMTPFTQQHDTSCPCFNTYRAMIQYFISISQDRGSVTLSVSIISNHLSLFSLSIENLIFFAPFNISFTPRIAVTTIQHLDNYTPLINNKWEKTLNVSFYLLHSYSFRPQVTKFIARHCKLSDSRPQIKYYKVKTDNGS